MTKYLQKQLKKSGIAVANDLLAVHSQWSNIQGARL